MKREKRIIFLVAAYIIAATTSFSYAQSSAELRDSLGVVAEQVRLHPDLLYLRLQKASLNMQLEQYDYARMEYDYVLQKDPDNLAALFFRAWCNEKLFRYGFARADYEHLLKLVPDNFEVRLSLALLNHKDKHLTIAYDQINMLVEQHPDSAIVWAARGGMEKDRMMTDAAIYDFTQAIRLDPGNTSYLLSRCELYLKEKKYADAREDLQALVSLGVDPSSLQHLFKQLPKKKKKKRGLF